MGGCKVGIKQILQGNYSHVPPNLKLFFIQEILQILHKNIANITRNIANIPRNIVNIPKNIANIPGNIANIPKNIANIPRNIAQKLFACVARLETILHPRICKSRHGLCQLLKILLSADSTSADFKGLNFPKP